MATPHYYEDLKQQLSDQAKELLRWAQIHNWPKELFKQAVQNNWNYYQFLQVARMFDAWKGEEGRWHLPHIKNLPLPFGVKFLNPKTYEEVLQFYRAAMGQNQSGQTGSGQSPQPPSSSPSQPPAQNQPGSGVPGPFVSWLLPWY